MSTWIQQVTTTAFIPTFTPAGTLFYAQDTGALWMGTGYTLGSDVGVVGGVNIEQVGGSGGGPGGFNGDIQYNNNGALGGSAATITAAGTINIPTGQNYEINGVPIGSSAWAALTGDLTSTQVIPFDGSVVGTPDTGVSRLSSGVVGIGTGASTSTAGGLVVTTATIPNLIATTATVVGVGNISTLISPNATITTLTATTATIATLNTVTATVASGSLTITDIAANPDLTLFNPTAATATSTNASPTQKFAVFYDNAGIFTGLDTWTIGSSVTVGSNGASTLTVAHSGSSGNASVVAPSLGLINAGGTPCSLYGVGSPSSGISFSGGTTMIYNNGNALYDIRGTGLRMASGISIGWSSSGTNADGGTSPDTTLSRNNAGIVQIGTTAANASGNLAANSFAAGGVVASPAAGVYYSSSTAGVSAGPFSAITSIQTVGGIVTTLADVSDERLKDHAPYTGGLKEILSITPVKYTWNAEGKRITGFGGDRQFVGFRAQDVRAAIPEAVSPSVTNPEYFGFDDRPVIAALVNSVKELSARVKELEQPHAGKKAEE